MIDPTIALSYRPPQVESPIEAYGQAMNLRSLANQQQLQQQQLQTGQLQQQALGQENQMRQTQMAQTQALNQAYKDSLTIGADGSASVDSGKLTKALAAAGAGSRIPEVLKGVTEYQQSIANLAKTNSELAALQTDAAGGLGATVKSADYDPRLFMTLAQHAVDAKAVDPKLIGPMMDQVGQALQQDPSGKTAQALVRRVSDSFIAQSPAQQKLAAEALTAQGAADRGKAALTDAALKQDQADKQAAAMKLAAAGSQAEYANALNALPHGLAVQFPPAETWNAQTTPKAALRVAMTPEQQTQADQAAANAAETARHNKTEESQGARRIGIEAENAATNQGRLGVERINAGLDANGQPISYADAQGNPINITPLARQIAQYKLPPVSARSYNSNRGLMNQVLAANPNFDIGQYEQRYKTMKDLAPSGPLGQQALALNTLVRHSDDMIDAATALNNGNIQAFNAAAQKIAQWTGKAAPTNFDQLKQYVAGETVKLVRGGGGTKEDVEAAQANLDRANSPDQLMGALRVNFGVAGGKMAALNSAVRTATGNADYTALDPDASQIMQKRGYDPATLKPAASAPQGASKPSPQAAPPPRTADPTSAAAVKVGQIVKLRSGKTITVTAVHPNGTFDGK